MADSPERKGAPVDRPPRSGTNGGKLHGLPPTSMLRKHPSPAPAPVAVANAKRAAAAEAPAGGLMPPELVTRLQHHQQLQLRLKTREARPTRVQQLTDNAVELQKLVQNYAASRQTRRSSTGDAFARSSTAVVTPTTTPGPPTSGRRATLRGPRFQDRSPSTSGRPSSPGAASPVPPPATVPEFMSPAPKAEPLAPAATEGTPAARPPGRKKMRHSAGLPPGRTSAGGTAGRSPPVTPDFARSHTALPAPTESAELSTSLDSQTLFDVSAAERVLGALGSTLRGLLSAARAPSLSSAAADGSPGDGGAAKTEPPYLDVSAAFGGPSPPEAPGCSAAPPRPPPAPPRRAARAPTSTPKRHRSGTRRALSANPAPRRLGPPVGTPRRGAGPGNAQSPQSPRADQMRHLLAVKSQAAVAAAARLRGLAAEESMRRMAMREVAATRFSGIMMMAATEQTQLCLSLVAAAAAVAPRAERAEVSVQAAVSASPQPPAADVGAVQRVDAEAQTVVSVGATGQPAADGVRAQLNWAASTSLSPVPESRSGSLSMRLRQLSAADFSPSPAGRHARVSLSQSLPSPQARQQVLDALRLAAELESEFAFLGADPVVSGHLGGEDGIIDRLDRMGDGADMSEAQADELAAIEHRLMVAREVEVAAHAAVRAYEDCHTPVATPRGESEEISEGAFQKFHDFASNSEESQ